MSERSNPMERYPLLFITIGGILLTLLTLTWTWRMGVAQFGAITVGSVFVTVIFYMTTVRFYSPLAVFEDGTVMTTFDGRTEVVYDAGMKVHFGIVFAGGYNSAKRAFSYKDINTGRGTIFVTPDPSMIESIGNGRFLLIRGTPYEASPAESRAFLDRPAMQAALGEELKSARVNFCFSSRTLKPDDLPHDPTKLGELSNLFELWHGEIEESTTKFTEEFMRRFNVIRDVKSAPDVEKIMKQKPEEETKE